MIVVSNSSEYKKAKDVNKNVVAKIGHNECKKFLLVKKGIHWIEFIVKIIKQELMKSTELIYPAFLTKFIFLIMGLTH